MWNIKGYIEFCFVIVVVILRAHIKDYGNYFTYGQCIIQCLSKTVYL